MSEPGGTMQLDRLTIANRNTATLIEYLDQAGISLIKTSDLDALFDRISRNEDEIKALEYRITTLMGA
jgi:phosphoribosylformimino-5-aminoimidazole carboxamide ribonucleotide (ProFAR) isomerase